MSKTSFIKFTNFLWNVQAAFSGIRIYKKDQTLYNFEKYYFNKNSDEIKFQ